jgi:hypothetical protein
VDVRTALVASAIQTWGFIKSGGTLRVFFNIILNTTNDDFKYNYIKHRTADNL